MAEQKYKHICEVCGRTELLTPQEAYQAGWDYPPGMGSFGIVSARTCPNCSIFDTVWAALTLHHKKADELTEKQKDFLNTITNYNIEVRYPEDKEALSHTLTSQACQELIYETKQLTQWIKDELSASTKPSDSSDATNKL